MKGRKTDLSCCGGLPSGTCLKEVRRMLPSLACGWAPGAGIMRPHRPETVDASCLCQACQLCFP
jgi:hypothetical protein